jgi:hypothetical protein
MPKGRGAVWTPFARAIDAFGGEMAPIMPQIWQNYKKITQNLRSTIYTKQKKYVTICYIAVETYER